MKAEKFIGFISHHCHLNCHVLFSAPSSSLDPKFRAPCLGLAGQPMTPEDILDDYPKDLYEQATTLIINFVLDNGEEIREKTEAWKLGFMNFMESYVANPRHSNLTITYSAGEELYDFLNTDQMVKMVNELH